MKTLAHISDLHIGRNESTNYIAVKLCESLIRENIDEVVLTGDITHKGKLQELQLFNNIFNRLIQNNKLIMVPGNHDCLNDNIAQYIQNKKIIKYIKNDLCIIRFNSTGPHNKSIFHGHGCLNLEDINAICLELKTVPYNTFVIVALHHHLLPLPEEQFIEKLSSYIGWPFAIELIGGSVFINRILGNCDMILHGHRHQISTNIIENNRILEIHNAGSTTSREAYQVFIYDNGKKTGSHWVNI